MRYFILAVGLVASNFLYQTLGIGDWSAALDRSWFQAWAVGACWALSQLPQPQREEGLP